jgi:hypothetical protein
MKYKLKDILGVIIFDNPIAKTIKSRTFSSYKLNVSEHPADPKDWVHEPLLNEEKDLPLNFSRRKISPPVKNQGRIGSCVGHSGRVVLGSTNKFQSEEPSPMWIYKTGKKYDAWAGENYSGTSIRGAASGAKHEGCCFESFWPYVDNENSEPKEGAGEDAAQKKIHSFYTIPCSDTNEIKSMLLDRPLWYAFMVHENFFSIGFNGIIDTEKYLSSNRAGGHAVCLIGWKIINDKLYWEFQNSWGPFHGNMGCFFMEDSLFKKVIINSVGPYYVEISDGYYNPDSDPVDPDPEPVDPDPEPVDPDPEPVDPDPEPVDPDPEPVDPDPEPKDSWIRKNIAWVVVGAFTLFAFFVFFFSKCSQEDIPTPPYFKDDGTIDWDRKLKEDPNYRNPFK